VPSLSSPKAVTALLHDLKKDFALKDLGDLHFFLGIEVNKEKMIFFCHKASMHEIFLLELECQVASHQQLLCQPQRSSLKLTVRHLGLKTVPSIEVL
jgi:hypothetical protein